MRRITSITLTKMHRTSQTKFLRIYFLDNNNITTYSLPKKHFDNIKKSNTFADTRRYFTIITGTDLVTNKIVSSYRTNQGTRYLLRKDYHQLIERMTRKNKREMVRQSQFPPKQHSRSSSSPQKSPFVEYLKIQNYNDDSSDDNNGSLPKSDQPIVNKTPSTTKNRANTIQKTFQPIQMMIYPLSKRNLRSWLLKLKQRWTMRSLPWPMSSTMISFRTRIPHYDHPKCFQDRSLYNFKMT